LVKTNRSFYFKKIGAPVFVKTPEPLAPVNKDEAVRLECFVEATPKPTVSWLFNAKELTPKDGIQIEKDANNNRYALVIPKVISSVHSGTITIKATNPIGSAQHELNLNVLGNFFNHLKLFLGIVSYIEKIFLRRAENYS